MRCALFGLFLKFTAVQGHILLALANGWEVENFLGKMDFVLALFVEHRSAYLVPAKRNQRELNVGFILKMFSDLNKIYELSFAVDVGVNVHEFEY